MRLVERFGWNGKMNYMKHRDIEFKAVCKKLGLQYGGRLRVLYERLRDGETISSNGDADLKLLKKELKINGELK